MILVHETHVYEPRIETIVFDPHSFQRYLSIREKGRENSGLNGDSNPDFCDAGPVLYQLSYQVNWELIAM